MECVLETVYPYFLVTFKKNSNDGFQLCKLVSCLISFMALGKQNYLTYFTVSSTCKPYTERIF